MMNNIKDLSPEKKAADAKPAAGQVPWNPLTGVLFVIVLYFVAQILSSLFVSIYPLLRHWSAARGNDWLTNSILAQFVFVLLAEGLTLAAIYAFLRHFRLGFPAIGLKRPRRSDPLYALAAVPAYYIAYAILVGVATHFTHLNANQQQDIGFTSTHGAVQLILTFVSLVILPPIAEEIMVRGFLYSSLKKAMPMVWAALVTSLLFASAHLPEGGSAGPLWIAAIDTFTLSLFLIYLREKTGSLWASITLHALKNGVAFMFLFVIHTR